jgi:hypothetical protein
MLFDVRVKEPGGVAEEKKRLYSATEVCAALLIKRTTFDAWMLRGYFKFGAGPGTGRARMLTFDEVIKVAALHHMTSLGIGVTQASEFIHAITRPPRPGDFLAATCDPPGSLMVATVQISPLEANLEAALSERLRRVDRKGELEKPVGIYRLDLHQLAKQVRRYLDGSARHDLEFDPDNPPSEINFTAIQRENDVLTSIRAKPGRRRRQTGPKKA